MLKKIILYNHIQTDLQLACERLDQNDYPAAIEMFSHVLKQDPQNAQALLGRGKAYYLTWQLLPARDDFSLCVSVAPEDVRSLFFLGITFLLLGEPETASELLLQAERIDSSEGDIVVAQYVLSIVRGYQMIAENRKQKVFRLIGDNEEKKKSASTLLSHMGHLFFTENKLLLARTIFEFAIEIDKKNGNLYVQRGIALECLDQYSDAEKDYQQALSLKADDPYAPLYLAMIKFKRLFLAAARKIPGLVNLFSVK